MAQFFGGAVWSEIDEAARTRRGRAFVAVAYFGKDADAKLKLKSGDLLVVNASRAAVRAGQTHPKTLLRLLRSGVSVSSRDDLHAKVYVLGKHALIGSANASDSSRYRLKEALVATTSRKQVSAARHFVRSLEGDPLTEHRLKQLAREYRPPRGRGSRPGRKAARKMRPGERVWVDGITLGEVPASDCVQVERGEVRAERKFESTDSDLQICWCGRSHYQGYRLGDTVLQVVRRSDGSKWCVPPGVIVHRLTRKSRRGHRVYIYLECPPQREVAMRTAKKGLEPSAFHWLKRAGTLLVRNKDDRTALREFWASRGR